MVAPVVVIPFTATLEITGAPAVVSVELLEAADVPLAFAETTSKSYRVPAVKPVNVTEWLVTSAVFNVVDVPYADVAP